MFEYLYLPLRWTTTPPVPSLTVYSVGSENVGFVSVTVTLLNRTSIPSYGSAVGAPFPTLKAPVVSTTGAGSAFPLESFDHGRDVAETRHVKLLLHRAGHGDAVAVPQSAPAASVPSYRGAVSQIPLHGWLVLCMYQAFVLPVLQGERPI